MRDNAHGQLLGFVGDVYVDRANPDEAFDIVRDVLSVPDLLMGNCECAYSSEIEYSPGVTVPVAAHPRNIPSMANAGFDLMTLANNHALDAGHRGLFEMHAAFDKVGIAHVGTGHNLADARRPAILRAGDLTVAVLSYASFFPRGYEALDDWPGLAPIRAWNHYRDRLPNVWSPGTPPIVTTIPHDEDMANLREDVIAVRAEADLVVVQFHGGDYKHPFVLSDHELRIARFAVDNGADIVAAHHHHTLRGIEWYKDAPIFYGLGHFVFDLANFRGPKEIVTPGAELDPETDDSYDLAPRRGWPLLPWHRDGRMTMLAWVEIDGGKVSGAGFLPCMLNRAGQVYPVDAESADGRQVAAYVQQGCSVEDLNARLMVERDGRFAGLASVRVIPRPS